MIAFRCLNPMCARPWLETHGFSVKLPPKMRDRCPWCGHKSIAEAVRR